MEPVEAKEPTMTARPKCVDLDGSDGVAALTVHNPPDVDVDAEWLEGLPVMHGERYQGQEAHWRVSSARA